MNQPSISLFISVIVSLVTGVQAQSSRSIESITRPRLVAGSKTNHRAKAKSQDPSGQQQQSGSQSAQKTTTTPSRPQPELVAGEESGAAHSLSPNRLRSRINEAQRLMKIRPIATAMRPPSLEYVTLAALLPETSQIHLIRMAKKAFLTRGLEVSGTTSLGLPVQIRILRANGVNTAVTVFDGKGRSLLPLVVEFPIERRGVFHEMAYYTSAHPALLSVELVKSGQTYVNSMIDLAGKRLRERGVNIASNIMDVAKRLCIVEHIDHDRFRNENRIALFEEVYTLYAVNELDTFRYSVSSAGAGGMVQMIPWTYSLMRQRYPGVGLNPDFVTGMRNHGNALEAMLLYMQDTWNDLAANQDVQAALSARQATVTELLAAGYNSNSAKLPGYLRRAGAGWRTLIPRETQNYLTIYQSLDTLMRPKDNHRRKT